MKFCELNKTHILLSAVELSKKLTGLANIWSQVVSGIGAIYCELFFRPGISSRVGFPFQLQRERNTRMSFSAARAKIISFVGLL